MASPISFPNFEHRFHDLYGYFIFFHLAYRSHIGIRERVFFLAAVSLYFFTLILQAGEHGFEWMRFYLKDLIFVPIMLTAIKISAELFFRPISVGTKEVIIAVVYAVFVFEWLLPLRQGMEFALDWIDILSYSLGGMVYLMFFKSGITDELEKELNGENQ